MVVANRRCAVTTERSTISSRKSCVVTHLTTVRRVITAGIAILARAVAIATQLYSCAAIAPALASGEASMPAGRGANNRRVRAQQMYEVEV